MDNRQDQKHGLFHDQPALYRRIRSGEQRRCGKSSNGPGAMNVVSEYRREWNFNAGTVCLEGFEGKDGEAPYIEHNYGCFDIPDNAHVDRIRATLGM